MTPLLAVLLGVLIWLVLVCCVLLIFGPESWDDDPKPPEAAPALWEDPQ